MRLVNRYLLGEMVGPALAALLAFVVLITGHLLFTVVDVLAGKGIHLWDVLRFVACKAPEAAVLALPVAAMLGCALGLNRLAADGELVPMLGAGLSGYRLMIPSLCLGAAATVLSVAIKEFVVPWAGLEADRFYRQAIMRQKTLAFKPNTFLEAGGRWRLLPREVDDAHDRLRDLWVFMERAGQFPLLFHAQVAQFSDDYLTASEVTYHDFTFPDTITWGSGSLSINLSRLPSGVSAADTLPGRSLRRLLHERAALRGGDPGGRREYDQEIHGRLSVALACVVFALLAVPISLRFGRGQSLAGVLATLVLAFAYFVVMLGLRLWGANGTLPVPVAAWTQDVALATWALLAVRRL